MTELVDIVIEELQAIQDLLRHDKELTLTNRDIRLGYKGGLTLATRVETVAARLVEREEKDETVNSTP